MSAWQELLEEKVGRVGDGRIIMISEESSWWRKAVLAGAFPQWWVFSLLCAAGGVIEGGLPVHSGHLPGAVGVAFPVGCLPHLALQWSLMVFSSCSQYCPVVPCQRPPIPDVPVR